MSQQDSVQAQDMTQTLTHAIRVGFAANENSSTKHQNIGFCSSVEQELCL